MTQGDSPRCFRVGVSLTQLLVSMVDMKVSINGDTPNSSILIGFSIINHPFGGNLHVSIVDGRDKPTSIRQHLEYMDMGLHALDTKTFKISRIQYDTSMWNKTLGMGYGMLLVINGNMYLYTYHIIWIWKTLENSPGKTVVG